MTRISPLSDDMASPAAATLFAGLTSKIGMVPNLYRVVGQSAPALEALLTYGAALDKGGLTASEGEAIALATAGINACDYCASAHTAVSKMLKRDTGEIAANLHGQSTDARTAALLKLAGAIIQSEGKVSDAVLAEAKLAGLSEADIVETLAHVVKNIFTNWLNHLAATPIDFPVVNARAA